MLFPGVLFSSSVGTVGKLYRVCGKYSFRNFHTRHPKISSDRQGGEMVAVKDKELKIGRLRHRPNNLNMRMICAVAE